MQSNQQDCVGVIQGQIVLLYSLHIDKEIQVCNYYCGCTKCMDPVQGISKLSQCQYILKDVILSNRLSSALSKDLIQSTACFLFFVCLFVFMKPVRFGQGEDNFPSSEAGCLQACAFLSSRELTSFDCTNCAMTETEVSSYSCGDCGHVCSYMMELHVVHLGHKGSTGSGKQDTIFCSFAG